MRKSQSCALSAIFVAALSACGGGAKEDTTSPEPQQPEPGSSFTNPLNLKPAPQFSTSSRAVTYDDCFPRFDDVVVGDVVKSKVETFGTTADSLDQTETVTAVTPTSFNGRAGVSVSIDNPPYVDADNVMQYGVESKALYLRGGTLTTFVRYYLNDSVGTYSSFTNTPIAIGDLSAGHDTAPFVLGESVTNRYSFSYVNNVASQFNRQGEISEKITFIGVEEGTEVLAGKFDYTCVFRREISSTINGQTIVNVQDYYTHKWSGVKELSFDMDSAEPEVYQLFQVVSNSAIERRKNTP